MGVRRSLSPRASRRQVAASHGNESRGQPALSTCFVAEAVGSVWVPKGPILVSDYRSYWIDFWVDRVTGDLLRVMCLLLRVKSRPRADGKGALEHLAEEIMDLPALDLSLLVELPRFIGPDLERLCEAIEHDDPDWGWDALTAVHSQVDSPQQRARLADAVVRLRDQNRIGRRQAAFALMNLHSKSNRFIAACLLEAVAVHTGVEPTPGGLKIAA
jgi:hypothetical protein